MTFLFFFAAIHVQQQPAQSSKTITRGRTVGRAEARRERDRGRRASMIPDQVASRRARARERHASMTPEQRQSRRVRQNARNAVRRTTPGPNYVVGSGVTMIGSNNLDALNVVYQNLPESTHMLKPNPDCRHCSAKKFEYESL